MKELLKPLTPPLSRFAGEGVLLSALLLLSGGPALAQTKEPPIGEKRPSLEGLFLDFSKTQLGPLNSQDARKKYMYTIQLEKSKLMHKLLRTVYENAYELYRQGDFEGSRELTG